MKGYLTKKIMDVSIILVSYNTKDLTRDCLRSIYEKTQGIEFEIFVVDNNSHDGSPEMIEQEFPDVRLIRNSENKGFGAANNIAIRQSNAKYIFCLNTDTILLNNAVKIFFDFMEHPDNQNVGLCGGNLFNFDMKPCISYAPFPNALNCTSLFWLFKKILPQLFAPKEIVNIIDVDSIIGADIFLRKDIFEEIGLFDENIFMYSEEIDLCKRVKDNGYEIKAIPEPKIIHLEGRSCFNFLKNIKLRVKSKYYYLRKHNLLFCVYLMKISYFFLHLSCFIFTMNKDHYDLMVMHING